MTHKEWWDKQDAYEEELKKKGLDEIDISRSCWWCRDTSQCDETCMRLKDDNN